jgi:hypothetical protein
VEKKLRNRRQCLRNQGKKWFRDNSVPNAAETKLRTEKCPLDLAIETSTVTLSGGGLDIGVGRIRLQRAEDEWAGKTDTE